MFPRVTRKLGAKILPRSEHPSEGVLSGPYIVSYSLLGNVSHSLIPQARPRDDHPVILAHTHTAHIHTEAQRSRETAVP